MKSDPTTLLHQLERARVARRGERALEVEAAASAVSTDRAPVLLLTDTALYAFRASTKTWERLPLGSVRELQVMTDPTGMLTRYVVRDSSGAVWLDLAVAMSRPSFRQRLQHVAERLLPPASARVALLRRRRDAHLAVLAPALAA